MTALHLAAEGKAKSFTFVSTTSVLEKPEHYVPLSDSILTKGGRGISERDDLEASRHGLTTGYGQSKWVCEKLIMEAAKKGLQGGIVRPSYVVGDSASATTNTDDFLWRLIKGCIQLGSSPEIYNAFNMAPVDHVARIVRLAAFKAPTSKMPVYHVTVRPLIRFTDFLGSLPRHGYKVETCEYIIWRERLEKHVMEAQDNALFPLLHFVLEDLPANTKGPELDDTNTETLLSSGGYPSAVTIDEPLMAKYLAWLVASGFLPEPTGQGAPLPLANYTNVRSVGRSGR